MRKSGSASIFRRVPSSSVQNGRSTAIKRWRSIIMLQELSPFHIQVLGNELRAQAFVPQHGKPHSPALQGFLQLPHLVPAQVAAKLLIKLVGRGDVRVGKKRRQARRLQHIYQNQVLPADELDVADK